MKNVAISIPGYKLNEYLLVLNPNEDLRRRIMNVKEQFSDTYKADTARFGKPHIPLAKFVQYQMKEERLINRLKTVAMGHHPFKVELKDFGSFPSHSIYINVTSKIPVQHLVERIRSEAQQIMKLNATDKAHFIMEPQVSITRKLQPWQYEKAWLEYSKKHFTGRFIADSMLLLKRPVGTLKYQIAQLFEFQNLPVTTVQGALFA